MTETQEVVARRGADGPAWRWLLAHQLAAGHRTQLGAPVDPDVRMAAEYLRRRAGRAEVRETAARDFPLVAAALALTEDLVASEKLKILVLANTPRSEIASRLGIDEETLQVWESVFFDARAALSAIDWIVARVIEPEQANGSRSLAAKLRLVHTGGPVAARAILDMESGVPISAGERVFQRQMKLYLMFTQAADMPLETNADAFRFTVFYSKLRMKEKQLELEKQKLQQRCVESLRNHEFTQQRLLQAIERRRQRAESRARRAGCKAVEDQARERRRQEQFRQRQEQLLAEKRAALARMMTSPLAQLKWGSSAEQEVALTTRDPKGDKPQERAVARIAKSASASAGGDDVRHAVRGGASEGWQEYGDECVLPSTGEIALTV